MMLPRVENVEKRANYKINECYLAHEFNITREVPYIIQIFPLM